MGSIGLHVYWFRMIMWVLLFGLHAGAVHKVRHAIFGQF